MSRKKHKAAKRLGGLDPYSVWKASRHGEKYLDAPDVFGFYTKWRIMLEMLSEHKLKFLRNTQNIRSPEWRLEEMVLELVGCVNYAITERDGSFFQDFADVVKLIGNPSVDPLRAWLAIACFDCIPHNGEFKQFPPRTINQLVKMYYKATGNTVAPRQLSRTCSELGIKVAPDKVGRPRKGK